MGCIILYLEDGRVRFVILRRDGEVHAVGNRRRALKVVTLRTLVGSLVLGDVAETAVLVAVL